jgi:hypothetical protein
MAAAPRHRSVLRGTCAVVATVLTAGTNRRPDSAGSRYAKGQSADRCVASPPHRQIAGGGRVAGGRPPDTEKPHADRKVPRVMVREFSRVRRAGSLFCPSVPASSMAGLAIPRKLPVIPKRRKRLLMPPPIWGLRPTNCNLEPISVGDAVGRPLGASLQDSTVQFRTSGPMFAIR